MAISFKCPVCQALLHAVSDLAGKPSTCPKCNKVITVPQEAEAGSDDKDAVKKSDMP